MIVPFEVEGWSVRVTFLACFLWVVLGFPFHAKHGALLFALFPLSCNCSQFRKGSEGFLVQVIAVESSRYRYRGALVTAKFDMDPVRKLTLLIGGGGISLLVVRLLPSHPSQLPQLKNVELLG